MNHDLAKAKRRLIQLVHSGCPVFFVPGNMDNPRLGEWIGEGNVRLLHGRQEIFQDIILVGLGGSPHGSFTTPFEYGEDAATHLLGNTLQNSAGMRVILLSHCPPKNTKIDQVSSGEHAGSTAVREFVERIQPFLVVSGHIHEAQGVDKIGRTILVNTGPAHRGNYAKIELTDTADVLFGKLF